MYPDILVVLFMVSRMLNLCMLISMLIIFCFVSTLIGDGLFTEHFFRIFVAPIRGCGKVYPKIASLVKS